jgi:phage terminase large subunit
MNAIQQEENYEFPEKLSFLIFEPSRYKVLYGGRGAGKTENIARGLIILCRARKLRIACFRELQTSIAESVHETLSNAINEMNLWEEFDVQKTRIICKRTGSEFIFSGLRHNINKIKSLARIDIAWIEEAVNVSRSSWSKLGPTIRGRHKDDPAGMGGPFGMGPEIWVSFNPELDSDETYVRFILKKEKYAPDYIEDEDTKQKVRFANVVKINHSDNKWLPDDLKYEMQVTKANDEPEYLHVWEGHTKVVLDGAIYADEIKKVLKENRRGKVPYDNSRPVHTFWDLGHDDFTSIWFVQQVGVEYNIIGFFQDRLKKIPFYLEYLQELKYNYGFHYIPHDGDNETLAARSVKKQIESIYPKKVKVIPRVRHKVDGIRAARLVFDLCNFDEENTQDGWQCLTRYQYEIDEETGTFSREPLHNIYSHGADAFQTFALSLKPETGSKKKEKKVNIGRAMTPASNGWMAT